MKLWVKKTLHGLQPISRTDADRLQSCKLVLGQVYEVEIKKKRNYEFHKKFFALLNLCFENQEKIKDFDSFRSYITMKAGYYTRIDTDKGAFYLPKSISFGSMDEVEFNALYDAVLSQVLLILDCTKDEIVEALKDF